MVTFYNYIYLDPRKPGQYCYEGLNFSLLYEPFYIGKGKDFRKHNHLEPNQLAKQHYKSYKIKAITKLGFNMKDFIIQLNNSAVDEIVKENEIVLIANIGRADKKLGPLTNCTDGGDSPSNVEKALYSKTLIGLIEKYGIEEGNKIYNDRKEKQRMRMLGNNNPSKRPEVRLKKSLAQKGKVGKHKGLTLEKIMGEERATKRKQDWSEKRSGTQVGSKNHHAKTWCFISPTGEKFIITGSLKTFCQEHGLKSPAFLSATAKGLRPDYKGWTGYII